MHPNYPQTYFTIVPINDEDHAKVNDVWFLYQDSSSLDWHVFYHCSSWMWWIRYGNKFDNCNSFKSDFMFKLHGNQLELTSRRTVSYLMIKCLTFLMLKYLKKLNSLLQLLNSIISSFIKIEDCYMFCILQYFCP